LRASELRKFVERQNCTTFYYSCIRVKIIIIAG
jgi:hypothetical protein